MDWINFNLRMANMFKQEAIQFKINGHIYTIYNVDKITGKNIKFYKVDLLDKEALHNIFEENIDSPKIKYFQISQNQRQLR